MASNYTPMAKEDTYRLIQMAKDGDEDAKEIIVKQNTGLVKNIALKFTLRGYELEDLLQIGFIGLLKAVERFDPSFDVMFSTYAVPMIMGEIKRYVRDDGRIKVSRQLKQDIRNMNLLQEEYYNKTGSYPKLSTLAELMEISSEQLTEIMTAQDALGNIESIDNPEKPRVIPEFQGNNTGYEEDRQVDMIFLMSAIKTLSERERQIIVLRYFKDMTQQQIAVKIGISQVQVSRIEKKILVKLKEKIAE